MKIETSLLESVYDGLIQSIVPKESSIDWLLVKAVMKQESAFNPIARSSAGAMGLMQLMPATDKWVDGEVDGYDIYKNIKGGVWYLNFLFGFWSTRATPKDEIYSFILGSYNAGQGNILKARDLSKSRGLWNDKWSDIVKVLELVTGPANARETTDYVERIAGYYQAYKGTGPIV